VRHSFIDRFANLDSPLHILDARTKLLGFATLIIAILLIPSGRDFVFFAYFFLIAILAGISQIPLGFIIRRTLTILPFIILATLAAPWRGISGLSALFMRAILCLIVLIVLTNTTRFVELLRGLRGLGCPQILSSNLGFLYRYLFVLTEEFMRMRQARDCRRVGHAPFKKELAIMGSMLGTLLVRSFERGERMYNAMLSRGYAGEFPVVNPHRFSWPDLIFLLGIALFVWATYFGIPIPRI
jgi:cobalt/nickel transport system permease protein